jgi:hypothetical protein
MRRRDLITLIGGAAVWPLAARAQQPAMPVIGFMSARAPEDSEHLLAAVRRGLGESGFIEGRNAAVEYRWARGDYARLPALAAELVNRRVAVLLTTLVGALLNPNFPAAAGQCRSSKQPQEPSVAPSSSPRPATMPNSTLLSRRSSGSAWARSSSSPTPTSIRDAIS